MSDWTARDFASSAADTALLLFVLAVGAGGWMLILAPMAFDKPWWWALGGPVLFIAFGVLWDWLSAEKRP